MMLLFPPLYAHTAPSGAPEVLSAMAVNSTAIDVQWSELDCALRNGDIIAYVVMRMRQVGDHQTVHVPGNQSSITITGLDPLTEYMIRVAAVNRNGTGPFSEPFNATTLRLDNRG